MRVGLDATEADMPSRSPGSGWNEDGVWLQGGECTSSNVVGVWRRGDACECPAKFYGVVDKAPELERSGYPLCSAARATTQGAVKEQESVGLRMSENPNTPIPGPMELGTRFGRFDPVRNRHYNGA